MTRMMQEGSQNESNYVTEYNEVISEISKICAAISTNQANPMQTKPVNEPPPKQSSLVMMLPLDVMAGLALDSLEGEGTNVSLAAD